LSAAVGPSGKVYGQNPDFFTSREGFAAGEKARNDRLGNVTPVHGELAAAGIKNADAAVTALNMHDIYNSPAGEAGAVQFAKGVFDALKPGGVFGVIDHVGIAGQDNAKFHRIQIEQAKEVLTKAGFKIEAESKILANPADDHTKGVRDPSVAGHTDQFIIRARKPG
jgi:predicted methyltransferase